MHESEPTNHHEHASDLNRTLDTLHEKVQSVLEETADSERPLNDRAVMAEVNEETRMISERLLNAVKQLVDTEAAPLTVEAFAEQAWEILLTPLTIGIDRAAMNYYVTEQEYHRVVQAYQRYLHDRKAAALQSL